MRNVFLLLMLLNFGAFALFQWVIEKPAPGPPYQGPGITLLREMDSNTQAGRSRPAPRVRESAGGVDELALAADARSADAIAAEAGGPGANLAALGRDTGLTNETAASAARCLSFGPFLGAVDADSAIATLIASGLEARLSIREDQVWEGYRVYIDSAEDFEAAREISANLNDNGIDATPVVGSAGGRTPISLGVYSDISVAGDLAERAGELGYDASIADSMITAETHWLDVQVAGDESVVLDLLQSPGRISRLEALPCAAGNGV